MKNVSFNMVIFGDMINHDSQISVESAIFMPFLQGDAFCQKNHNVLILRDIDGIVIVICHDGTISH